MRLQSRYGSIVLENLEKPGRPMERNDDDLSEVHCCRDDQCPAVFGLALGSTATTSLEAGNSAALTNGPLFWVLVVLFFLAGRLSTRRFAAWCSTLPIFQADFAPYQLCYVS